METFEKLYLITKLQNLKAIHNTQLSSTRSSMLYLITKLQNLKAIHNRAQVVAMIGGVVSNYKITKSESYSQLFTRHFVRIKRCI